MNKTLITGGEGRLATELKKHIKGYYPTRQKLDITDPFDLKNDYELIIHAAAYTNVDLAEAHRFDCINVNVLGTYNLLEQYFDIPFVFISTEHVNAKGVYFESKKMGEILVKNIARKYLIIRTLFKPRPYPWREAWIDQMTQGDYVDVIGKLVAEEIKNWNEEDSKTVYVGTGRKSIYELALQTRPDVKPILVEDHKGLPRPKDYL